jgi:hypothetical protein
MLGDRSATKQLAGINQTLVIRWSVFAQIALVRIAARLGGAVLIRELAL